MASTCQPQSGRVSNNGWISLEQHPPTYDQAARQDGHKTDHRQELRKSVEY